MMRGLLVVVVALGLAGCAQGVDEPIPVPPGPRAPVDHPQQTLGTDPPGDVLDNEPRAHANLEGPNLLPTLDREQLPKFPVPKANER
jgi:hypothetical protein